MRIVDADAHMLEPPALWTGGSSGAFRDRAPHIEKDPSGRKGSFFVCEDYRHCVSKSISYLSLDPKWDYLTVSN
jgi:hypothetical protein